MSWKNVKAFYARLVNDKAFQAEIQGFKSKDECSQVVQAAGYVFTEEEFETFTAQLLESKVADGSFKDLVDDSFKNLSEEELEAVVGGAASTLLGTQSNQLKLVQAYGVVIPSLEYPPLSPIYGVVMPSLGLSDTVT